MSTGKPAGAADQVEPLSEREIDVLRLAAEGLIRAYQAGMRDYLSAVTGGQEAERERLAHDLHDDTVQALIALRQRARWHATRLPASRQTPPGRASVSKPS